MKKVKVALLIDEFFGGAGTAFGGYGFLARNYIAKYIPDKNIQIDVLLEMRDGLKKTICEKVDNMCLYRLPKDTTLAKKWLDKQNYDLFLSIEMTWPSHEIFKLVKNKKLILWIQDPRPEKFWEPKRNSMSVIQDPCICDPLVSNLIKDTYNQNRMSFISQGHSLNPLAQELYKLPKNFNVTYLPNPIDIDFDYKFDIEKKKKQVIFLGRLEAQKRVWLFCEVAKRMPEYEFFVMGKFFRHEEENKKTIQKYLDMNIPNLHFTGHLEGEEKEKLIRESRVILNTSIWEGIPISWLECLQYGTTLVSCLDNENLTSRFGSYVGEIIGDGKDKVDLFIPAIKKLMEDDEYYKEKAESAVEYIRKNHNIEKFKNDLRNIILKESKEKFVMKFEKPVCNQIDVKISYACNFKCEYCYQVDENGERLKGFFEKKNIDNLIKFIKRTKLKNLVNLVGGEPFIYPYLTEFAEKLVKIGQIPNIITNFSAPFEKIEKFISVVKNNLLAISISIHISQWENIQDFYNKLDKLVALKKDNNYKWQIWFSCVVTEENFDKAIEIKEYIKEKYGFDVVLQRVYYNGIYKIYSERIENYFKQHKLDVKKEQANNIDFSGYYCWAGARFFYVEHNGDVHRCYTAQKGNNTGLLGNLSNYKKIKINKSPYPCMSKDNGNCVCFKIFANNKVVTPYKCSEEELHKIENPKKYQITNYLKYYYYRAFSNFVDKETKNRYVKKKNEYKEKIK